MHNPGNALLIKEYSSYSNYKILSEKGSISDRNLKVAFQAVLQTFNQKNRNKRIYTLGVANEILKQGNALIQEDNFIGELDHPVSEFQERESTVEYKTASHKFTKIWLDGEVLYGEGVTLSTSTGMDMAALLKDGVKVGFSLRAMGFNIKKTSEVEIVEPPIVLITYDCVKTPSHKEAVVKKISLQEAHRLLCSRGICITNEIAPKIFVESYRRYLINGKEYNSLSKTVNDLFKELFNKTKVRW
jgi:hypothetical protein